MPTKTSQVLKCLCQKTGGWHITWRTTCIHVMELLHPPTAAIPILTLTNLFWRFPQPSRVDWGMKGRREKWSSIAWAAVIVGYNTVLFSVLVIVKDKKRTLKHTSCIKLLATLVDSFLLLHRIDYSKKKKLMGKVQMASLKQLIISFVEISCQVAQKIAHSTSNS